MKKSLLSVLAAVTVVTAAPAPAFAQNSAPPEDNPLQARRRAQAQGQQNPAQTASTRADLIRAVACQLGAAPDPLDAVLATAPYSAPEAAAVEALLPHLRSCNNNRPFTTPPAALRGAVAEALLKARFATPQAARTPALGAKPLLDVTAATARPDAASLVTSYGIADCMALTQADQVRALLAIDPGSPAEVAFFNATLGPLLSRCAATAGGTGTVSVDGRTLRGLLAESLYRWSVVQRDGAASLFAAVAAAH